MRRIVLAVLICACGSVSMFVPAVGASTATSPSSDSFYEYSGATPLATIRAGTVLKVRSESMHVEGIPLPIEGTQLLYRTTDTTGEPAVTATTVLKPLRNVFATPRLVSYQIAYDSLTNTCQPSYALAGGVNLADPLDAAESAALTSYLLSGYTVVTSDYEGEDLAFAAGPGSGRATLDGIRAALNSPTVGLPAGTPVGIVGYSGGAIATEWAAELAPSYAPDLNAHLVGAAQGGVFVDPAHNLNYVDGTPVWSAAIPAALVGISRAYHLAIDTYLSDYGKHILNVASHQCLLLFLGHTPGLTYQRMLKPQYQNVERVPAFVAILNDLIMGRHGTPTIPMLLAVGTGGILEGTPGNRPDIGAGDGVMIAGDVRALARQYCGNGVPVQFIQYNGLDHAVGGVAFIPQAAAWLAQRFDHADAPSNCATIAPGNPLAPIATPRRGGTG